jgi:hypothetical protein
LLPIATAEAALARSIAKLAKPTKANLNSVLLFTRLGTPRQIVSKWRKRFASLIFAFFVLMFQRDIVGELLQWRKTWT